MLTRRTALGAASALILMPTRATASPDPTFAAHAAWERAQRIEDAARDAIQHRYCNADGDLKPGAFDRYQTEIEAVGDTLFVDRWAAGEALAKTVATTPEGIAVQLRFAREAYIWDFENDDIAGALYASICAGVGRLAS